MQRGFSLLETIISIVALSFISIFILEMYMSASTLAGRARNVDIATTEAITAIEGVKQHISLNSYLLTETDAVQTSSGSIIVNRFYNADWEPLSIDTDLITTFVMASETQEMRVFYAESENAYYHLMVEISAGEPAQAMVFDIRTEVMDISRISQDGEKSLVALSTKKYFARGYGYEKDDSSE